ncbi:MAG: TldD/PmbA family protein [Deltaproteobacteria bacterium]|nr:TldD/PmbA family protein [Deltaproteobacteria bacterium]
MDPLQAIEQALSLAREHRERHVDVVLSRSESLGIRVCEGKVERVEQSTDLGLGLRVVQEGRTGLSFTERLTADTIEKAFLEARANAALLDPTEVVMNETAPGVPDPEVLELYNPALESLTAEDLTRFALEMEAEARRADHRVSTVTHSVARTGRNTYITASTHGVRYTQRSNSVGAGCGVLLESHGNRKSGSYGWSARVWDPAQAALVGREAAQRGGKLLGAKPIPGGKLPIVLDEFTAPALLSMYLGNFHAEAVQKGRSRLKGRLGELIASEDFTLTDDPHRVGAPGSRFLDAEGTPTRALNLIENGALTSFLYHIESARKENRASTGHAGRGYGGGIGTHSHNLVLPTGNHDLEALCALPERCLLVTELEGGSGCNPISGDISIGVQGFLMENGRSVQPVDSVTIAGNFYALLKSIRARGDRYQPHLSSRFIPALLVDGFTISG